QSYAVPSFYFASRPSTPVAIEGPHGERYCGQDHNGGKADGSHCCWISGPGVVDNTSITLIGILWKKGLQMRQATSCPVAHHHKCPDEHHNRQRQLKGSNQRSCAQNCNCQRNENKRLYQNGRPKWLGYCKSQRNQRAVM